MALAFLMTLLAALLALSRCFSAQVNSKDKIKRPAMISKSPGPGKGIKMIPRITKAMPMIKIVDLRRINQSCFIVGKVYIKWPNYTYTPKLEFFNRRSKIFTCEIVAERV